MNTYNKYKHIVILLKNRGTCPYGIEDIEICYDDCFIGVDDHEGCPTTRAYQQAQDFINNATGEDRKQLLKEML